MMNRLYWGKRFHTTLPATRSAAKRPYTCVKTCTKCSVKAVPWRVDITNASNNRYRIGGVWFNSTDSRPDTQLWN